MNFTSEQNIVLTKGDTFPIKAAIKQGGKAVNITGAVITFEFKPKAGGTIVSLFGTITAATTGLVEFSPSESDFSIAGDYLYRIVRVQSSKSYTHVKGRLKIEDSWA